MSNLAGDIDEILGPQALKNVELAIMKMATLHDRFKQNVTAMNLMNDALGKATKIMDVTKNIDALHKKAKDLQDTQTEFVKTQQNVDKAFRETGDVLNQLEKDYADVTNKATAMTVNNKKIIADNTAMKASIQTVDQQWKLLEADYKRLTLEARNMGAAHGVMSTQFKTSAANANIVRKEMDAINNTLGHSQSNVGNYASGLTKIWSGLRMIAYVVPGLGIAGIFSLAGDAIMEAAKGLEVFNSKWDRLNNLLSADSVTQAKKDMSELYVSVNLLHEGLISQEKFLAQYNATLGKTAGYTNDVKKAEQSILDNAEAYIEMVILKADAEELLTLAIEKSTKARKFQREEDDFFSTLKAQAIKGFNDFKKTGNFGLLFMADPKEARAEYQIAADQEAKIAQDAWLEARTKLAKQIKKNNFSDVDSVAPKKPDGTKEVNRINDIKAQYEEEVSLLKTKLNKEQITEEQFYSQMIDLSRKYYATRAGLTEKEKQTEIKFNETLSQSEKENHDAIIKWLEQEVLAAGEADDKRLKASLKRIEEIRKANEKAYQEELDYIKGQMDAQERMFEEDERLEQERFTQKMKYLGKTNEVVQSATSALSSIGDIMYMRDMERINSKNQALKDYYDNELRAIEESGLSQAQQAKEKKKLDAETAAQQKQIDRDRISAMRKQAGIQKGIDIASLIGSTTVAVMSALSAKPYSPLNIALAAGAAAKGAGELARLIATPLPQYAKGRKGGPAEWAIVSEVGQEAKVSKSGEMSLLPATKSKVFLNEGDSVIPHHDLLKHASYLKLAYSSANKTDNSTDALLQAHTEEIKELKGLRVDLRNKELSSNYINLSGYNNYKEANRM